MIKIQPATIEQKPLLSQLLQLYLYDFSEIHGDDVNQFGLYEYEYLDSYWIEKDRFPFLISVDDQIAGFVLVNSHSKFQESTDTKSIAEFFVIRKYRKQGVGKTVAINIFDKFPGKWEVCETVENVKAQQFWRKVIDHYTGGKFTETRLENDNWNGPIQMFNNSRQA